MKSISTSTNVYPHLGPYSFGITIILLKFDTNIEAKWRIEVPFTFKTSAFSCLSLFSLDLGRCKMCLRSGLYSQALVSFKDIYPSSSFLQGKRLPFSPSPLRLNIFRLFVILSLTLLYRFTPEIFYLFNCHI